MCCHLNIGSLPFLVRAEQVDSAKIKSQKPTTDELIQVLKDVRIEYILSRFSLDSTCEWSSVLSLGEQQRLAFARLLLSKPYLVLLDESTSALDEANEVHTLSLSKSCFYQYPELHYLEPYCIAESLEFFANIVRILKWVISQSLIM